MKGFHGRAFLSCALMWALAACGASTAGAPTRGGADPDAEDQSLLHRAAALPKPLGSVPVTIPPGTAIDARRAIMFLVRTEDPGSVNRRLAEHGRVLSKPETGLELEWDYIGRPSLDAVAPRYLEPSFVVDFHEPAVEKLAAEAARRFGEQPTQHQLTELVAAYIETAEGGRFDIASRAASRRTGDCTEHAVLLAALGRSFGIPSRVIMGYVLMPELQIAIGHAWTEMHDGARWLPSDSALRGSVNNRYLKTGELQDESVRYRLTNVSAVNTSIDGIALRGRGSAAGGSR